ncbi:MAG TPA: amidohydrolase [Syntrophaceae bacterium]|nr:amidohydrolase [Syntrophaceae bacterium]
MHVRMLKGQEKEVFDLAIIGGLVLTIAPYHEFIESGLILIKEGTIMDITKRELIPNTSVARDTITAEGCLIMPGLINTHTHAPMSLFRGMADDLPLMKWLKDYIFPAEAKLTEDMVYWGTLLSCGEMILSGTTTFCDGYFLEDQVAKAVKDSGMRAVLAQGVIDLPAPGIDDPKKNIKHLEKFIQTWKDTSALITPAAFCHSPYTCSENTLRDAKDITRRYNVPFLIHLSETEEEVHNLWKRYKKRATHYLRDLNVLDRDTLAVHCIWLDEDELDVLKEYEVKVSHNPESNMKLGCGVAPVPEMLQRGIIVGLGSDGAASNNNLDMFQEMDTAAKLHKVTKMDPTVLDAKSVVEMATIKGAMALNLEGIIGSLEKGKRADLIIIDMQKPHLTPCYNPYSHIVYAAKCSDVRHVIIDGKVVMKDRKLLTIDIEQVMGKVRAMRYMD